MEKQENRGGTRPGAGRPAVYEGKPSIIQIKVEPQRKTRYVKRAQAEGKTLSTWMLEAADRELER